MTSPAVAPRATTPRHDGESTRPVVTFHNGHRCTGYRTDAGFQECVHGYVRRIGVRRRTAALRTAVIQGRGTDRAHDTDDGARGFRVAGPATPRVTGWKTDTGMPH